jgi:hypothetical protein
MCAGSGPGPQRATITVPDYQAFDRMLDRQLSLMGTAQQERMLNKQRDFTRAGRRQQRTLEKLNTATVERAKNTEADAKRIMALIGAPAPEPTAKAPVLGANRTGKRRAAGKRGLRIDRPASAGLNIGGY